MKTPYVPIVSCLKLMAIPLILSFLLPQFSYAAENYKVGDTLFAAPTTGINIRTAPSLQAPVLKKVAYNAVVMVAADTLAPQPLQITVPDFSGGFLSLQGHWVKVKAGSITGYVFDGMLTKYKGLALSNYDADAFYAATFGSPSTKTIPKRKVIQGHTVDYETVIKTYRQGMVEEYTFFDGCHNLTYTFNFSFNEVYWLINRMMVGADAVEDVKIAKEGKETVLTFYSCT